MENKRSDKQLEINILKGILIITVVIGHSNPQLKISNIIYWFHMPAFFMISGYLFNKEKSESSNLWILSKRVTSSLSRTPGGFKIFQ